MSFFDGEACPDDNLKGILSIHLKLGKYIHSIKIWKSLDFGIDWLRNGRVITVAALCNAHVFESAHPYLTLSLINYYNVVSR